MKRKSLRNFLRRWAIRLYRLFHLAAALLFAAAGGILTASDLKVIDPTSLELLSVRGEAAYPRSFGMASGDDLLGFSSPGSLLYLEYGRGFLLLEEKGRPSGRTLIRLFMDRTGKATAFEPYIPPGGTVLSKPFLGGTLSLDLLRPDTLSLIISEKTIIRPAPAAPGPVIHFTAGEGIFWLGNGLEYRSYSGAGKEEGYFTLEETPLDGERVLFCEADRTGRLYLGLNGGGVLTVPGDCRGEVGADVSTVILDEGELFIEYYAKGEEILKKSKPEWIADYRRWAFIQTEKLHRADPFDRELGALYRELSD